MLGNNVLIFAITLFITQVSLAKPGISGKFMVVKGDVKINRAKNEVVKAKVAVSVFPGDTIISGADSRAKIVMEDKNVIHISPSTTLKIDSYVNDGTNKNVELNLKEGKVRNNVENTYDGAKNKFIIKTPTAVAGVRGTQFITSFNANTNITEVITLQGKVELTNLPTGGNAPQATVTVKPGERSQTSMDKAPEPPQPIPVDQIKAIDNDSVVGAGQGSSSGGTTTSDSSANTPNKGPAARVEDRQDQTPDTFNKLPDKAPNGQPNAGVGPQQGFKPPPPPPPLVNDAIRNKNDKTKVIIDAK